MGLYLNIETIGKVNNQNNILDTESRGRCIDSLAAGEGGWDTGTTCPHHSRRTIQDAEDLTVDIDRSAPGWATACIVSTLRGHSGSTDLGRGARLACTGSSCSAGQTLDISSMTEPHSHKNSLDRLAGKLYIDTLDSDNTKGPLVSTSLLLTYLDRNVYMINIHK